MENFKEEKRFISPKKFLNYYKLFLATVGFVLVFFGQANAAGAASFYLSPSSGNYQVDKAFSVSVFVSSSEQAMNAASGVIAFPQDKLEITSLSKISSIFSLWVQEPSFSNSAGVINFEGIVLNPGFTGSGGKIITINFKVKTAGAAALNFSSGSILANDGKGTNILVNLGNAQFNLGAVAPAAPTSPEAAEKETIPEPPSPTAISGAPSAPQIFSTTHPDSDKWYNDKNLKFSWILPAEVNGISAYFSESPTSNPGPVSDGIFADKSYENIGDGVWYFHIKFRNSYGWGPVAHFKIQIDTIPPLPFMIKFVDGEETENPQPTVVFDTTDALSGVDYYKVKIGEGDFINLSDEVVKANPYILPQQAPGKRNIFVQAIDKAGNYAIATEEFIVKPLKEPRFAEYPKELESNAVLIVAGESQYPNSKIVVWLQKDKDDPKIFMAGSDQDGKFIFTADEKLSDGIYKLWAEVIDARGAKSLPGEKITIVVKQPVFLKIGNRAITIFAVVVPLVALIIALFFVLWYSWRKFSLLRSNLSKEVHEAEFALHKAFGLLKGDISAQIKMLEKARTKRELTKEEEKIIKQLKKDLSDAEKFVKKEIEDIEMAIK